jgi:hypothetical protein
MVSFDRTDCSSRSEGFGDGMWADSVLVKEVVEAVEELVAVVQLCGGRRDRCTSVGHSEDAM